MAGKGIIDTLFVFRLLRKLTMKYEKWDAYKTGVIDKKGNILLKKKERETRVETSKQLFKTLNVIMKGKRVKVSRLEDKIYDFEAVESGRPGNPIGLIFKNQKGKEVIRYY